MLPGPGGGSDLDMEPGPEGGRGGLLRCGALLGLAMFCKNPAFCLIYPEGRHRKQNRRSC